jgi:hypothetical protein
VLDAIRFSCQLLSSLGCYPPSLQRQSLYPRHRGLNVSPERNDTNDDAQYIHDIISIRSDVAYTAAVDAAVLLMLQRARESLRDKRAFEEVGLGWDRGRSASSGGEHVDGFEDEEAGECAAKIGYTGDLLARGKCGGFAKHT